MSIFAIADLHLSSGGAKPMDIFGPLWDHHQEKIRERWLETVSPEDTVLVVGDTSWAMRFEEAIPDLEWIHQLPGTKVLVRGNHDYWWSSKKSVSKLRSLLPSSLIPLHRSSHVIIEGETRVGIVGTRGWMLPPATPHDAGIAATEEERLRASVASLPPVDRAIGMIHIPPFTPELESTVFVDILREAGVDIVVYGHVHRGSGRFFEGVRDGVHYRNVAVDQIDFRPAKIA